MDFDVAPNLGAGDAETSFQEIGAASRVPSSGLKQFKTLAACRYELASPDQLVVPDALDESFIDAAGFLFSRPLTDAFRIPE